MKNSIRMNNQRIYANSESFLNSIDHFSKISINLIDGIRCKLYNEVTLNKIRIMITEKFFLINCEKSFEANSRLNCLPQFLLHASNNFHFGGEGELGNHLYKYYSLLTVIDRIDTFGFL